MKVLLSKSDAIKFINKNRRLNRLFDECDEQMFDHAIKIYHEFWGQSKVHELKDILYIIKKVPLEGALLYELSI